MPGNAGSTKGRAGLAPEEVTIAETFKAAGYVTAHIGKWHLGYTPETMPNGQGFDHSFGHMGGCIDNYSHFFYWQGPNRHDLWRNGKEIFEDGKYFPQMMADEASKFIEKNRDKPFFMYYALNTPHYPYQGYAKWLKHYAKLPYPRNLYAAFLSTQDETIGNLLATLDRLKLREDTIIVFQSDHGHSHEERAHFGGGSAGIYRAAKFSLFEGGIRVPAIISWPSQLEENREISQIAHSCDWLPTLADLAGIKLMKTKIDGKSLSPMIKFESKSSPHSTLHWQVGVGPKKQWAVRQGPWKLIGNVRDSSNPAKVGYAKPTKLFLSNIEKDPEEKINWADEHPDIVKRLLEAHKSQL